MGDTKIEMKIKEEIKPLEEVCKKMVEEFCAEIHRTKPGDIPVAGMVTDMIKDLAEAKEKTVKACYYSYILGQMEKSEEEGKEDEKLFLKMLKEEYGMDEEEGKRFYRGQPRSRTSGRFMSRGDGRRSNGRSRGYEEMPYMMMPEIYNPEMMRDLDRGIGRMYYSGSGNSGSSSGGNSSYSGGNSGGNGGGYSGSGSGSGSSGGNSSGSRGYSEGYQDGNRRGYDEGYNEAMNAKKFASRYDNIKRNYTETKQAHKGNTQEDNAENMKALEKILNVIDEDLKELTPGMGQSEKNMTRQKLTAWSQRMA